MALDVCSYDSSGLVSAVGVIYNSALDVGPYDTLAN
jgi:hypothetical protein